MSTKRLLAKFSNYQIYHNISNAYNDFFQKLIKVVNNITPFKTTRIKNSSNEWFDREIAEKIKQGFSKEELTRKPKSEGQWLFII